MIRQFGKTLVFTGAAIFFSSLVLAAEKPCPDCARAKDGGGKDVAVMGTGLKMGDKLDCMDKGCRAVQEPRKPISLPGKPNKDIVNDDTENDPVLRTLIKVVPEDD